MNLFQYITSTFLGLAVAFLIVAPHQNADAQQTKYADRTLDAYAPFEELVQVTPADSPAIDPPYRGCIVEVAGDLVVATSKGTADVTLTVVAGQLVPAMITNVKTGTTATVVCGR